MPTASHDSYERGLMSELSEIDARIRKLKQEREMVVGLLAKARARRSVGEAAKRRNSVSRLLVETVILEALGASEGAMRSAELLVHVQRAVPDLKDTTFRSHLHRMKAQGIIENYRRQRGRWVACEAVQSVKTTGTSTP